MQAPGGTSKSAKFKDALRCNPLGPMADPFSGLNDDQNNDHQQILSNAVKKRLENQTDRTSSHVLPSSHQIQRHATTTTAASTRVGETRKINMDKPKDNNYERDLKSNIIKRLEEVDSDDEFLDELESDPAFEALRERRIQQMKLQQLKDMENRAKGHGDYRTISQDEFLLETTGSSSEWIVVHFYHNQFEKCKIMDHHLKQIAEKHIECKFLRIDSEKAPFFCTKLKVRTLPTVLLFQDGKTMGRLVGFEGISDNDEWPTSHLQKWLSGIGAIQYTKSTDELEQEMRHLSMSSGSIWRGGGVEEYDDEE